MLLATHAEALADRIAAFAGERSRRPDREVKWPRGDTLHQSVKCSMNRAASRVRFVEAEGGAHDQTTGVREVGNLQEVRDKMMEGTPRPGATHRNTCLLLALTLRLVLGPPPVGGQVFTDNFDDDSTSVLWSPGKIGFGPTVDKKNGRVEMAIPPGSTNGPAPIPSGTLTVAGFYVFACDLQGDFDIQVDYQLLEWPPASGVNAMLVPYPLNPAQRISCGVAGPCQPPGQGMGKRCTGCREQGFQPQISPASCDSPGSERSSSVTTTQAGAGLRRRRHQPQVVM
jgi:hypothetical protein